jgi:uncharacterized protein (TIGR02246 family)
MPASIFRTNNMATNVDRAIGELLENYKAAVYAKDVEAFVALFDQDARIFDLWAEWSYDGIAPWRGMVEQWFGSLNAERDLVEFDDVRATVSGELAVVHAFVRFTAMSAEGKALRTMQERLTWTLVMKERGWKISHQHTSAPIDFNTLKVILQR